MDKNKKILIIEDDDDIIWAMTITLESAGYSIVTSSDPEAAIQVAKSEKPALIILDVMFGSRGKTKGFDYAVKYKQEKSLAAIPILMVTAVNIEHPGFGFSAKNDGEYLPIDDFIDKPAQPEDLLEKVETLINAGVSKWVNWPDKS